MTDEQKSRLSQIVWMDAKRVSGTACFRGTRVPVQNLLDYLEGGSTINDFLTDFTSVHRDQVIQFLELAKDQLLECVSS
jgi:uncharacterized protein (DUF433 family)